MATSKFSSIKNHNVFITTFIPENQHPRAIIQMNHGLAEHSERYFGFAQYLCDNGFGVYLHDHPGHGKSVANNESPGHLHWNKGWDHVCEVIHNINKTIRKAHPNIPVFLFGHSLGSLFARYYNASYPMYFKGMIISGTTNPPSAELHASLAMVKMIHLFRKDTYKSKWLNDYLNNKYNGTLKNTNTPFDWLSSDKNQVQKYIDDPLCGYMLSLGYLKNIMRGSLQVLKVEKQLKFRKNFATLFISGNQDPVGNFGIDPKAIRKKYLDQGYFNTHLQLIDGRHELLNEQQPIKEKAYEIILTWMDEKLKGYF